MLAPLSAVAQAEPGEATLAEARRLFARGVAHARAERWREAADTFEAALVLHAAPPVRYNLAAALVEIGRYREARAQIDHVLADEGASPELRALAGTLAERVRAEAGRITIELSAETSGAEVTLDGEPLPEAWLAREIPVRPGAYTVAASRRDAVIAEAEVVVGAGDASRVHLVLAGSPGPLLHEDWRLWLGVGAGAVALTVLVVVAFVLTSSAAAGAPIEGNFTPGVLTW